MSYAKRRLHITISYNYIVGAGKVLQDLLHDVCDQVRHEVVGKVLFVFHMYYFSVISLMLKMSSVLLHFDLNSIWARLTKTV